MSLNEELKNILTDTERFLKQQQELYGDTIFVQKNEPFPADLTQKPASINIAPAAPEVDLFGNAVQPITNNHKIGESILPAYPKEYMDRNKESCRIK